MNQDTNAKDNTKLYSQRAIYIATFFGGPLVAGILARRNFINSGKEILGKNALIIGIITTILVFAGLFLTPEKIIDKIPNFLIPVIYTAITYFLIEKYQGSDLKEHRKNNKTFYPALRAAGIGAICMFILISGIFGYALLSPDNFDSKKYDLGIEEFKENEEKALQLLPIIESGDSGKVISHIENVGLPAWKQNLIIIGELDNMEGLYEPLKKQNEILRKYLKLRIETYQLIRKGVSEDTDTYYEQINKLNMEIDDLLKLL